MIEVPGGTLGRRMERLVTDELLRATRMFPGWPTDPVYAAAIVAEEAGELLQAANNRQHHGGGIQPMITECVQAIAMGYRCLDALLAEVRRELRTETE